MNETYDSPALDRSIFARRVPGISNGELVQALQRGEKPRDEPTMNDAFSRTSPEIYQHYQNAAGAQVPTYLAAQASTSNAGNGNSVSGGDKSQMNFTAGSAEQTPMSNEFAALRRRLLDVDASVREYHAKEMVRHGQVLETLDEMKSCAKMHVWILAFIGAIVIGLVVLLLCMVSKVSYGLSVHAANTNSQTPRRSNIQPSVPRDSESSGMVGV